MTMQMKLQTRATPFERDKLILLTGGERERERTMAATWPLCGCSSATLTAATLDRWIYLAGVGRQIGKAVAERLIAAGIVRAEGTVPDVVRQYLTAYAMQTLTRRVPRPPKSSKPTAA